jgi:outer membrane receptor for ferrienterochelin and colicins
MAQEAAEAESETPADYALGDVVVTGTRTETALNDSPARIDVISRAQVERSGARDVGELLEEMPGIVITRSFRGDAIQLGGLDPEYTLILVDGDRVPGRLGGGIDLGRYTVENIERIEVLRGPGSALYGSEAIAGVVNIITRQTSREVELEGAVQAGYGGGAIVDGSATGGVHMGPLAVRVSGGYHLSEAFRREPAEVATSGSARDQWSLGGRASLDLGGGIALDGRVEYLTRRLSGVDENAAGAVFDRVQLGEQLMTGVGMRVRTGDGTQIQGRLSYSLFREQFLNDQRGSQALDDVQDNREHLTQWSVQVDHTFDHPVLGNHRLSLGYEQLAQFLESDRLVASGRRFRIAPFLQDDWTIVEDGGLRFGTVIGARYDVDSQFGDQLSPRLGLRFDPVPQLVMRATYGWGFRAPSFQELLLRFENPSVGYIVNGNPALGAERSRGLDISVEWTPLREAVFTAAFYRNDLDGMITTVTVSDDPVSGTVFSYGNIARARTQGVELRGAFQPLRWLRLLAGYAFLETRDESLNRPLEGRPAHRITSGIQLDHQETGLGANVRSAVSLDRVVFRDLNADGTEEALWLDALAQLDVRVSWAFAEHFELSLGIDNLFDAGDAYLSLRPRTYWLGARARY